MCLDPFFYLWEKNHADCLYHQRPRSIVAEFAAPCRKILKIPRLCASMNEATLERLLWRGSSAHAPESYRVLLVEARCDDRDFPFGCLQACIKSCHPCPANFEAFLVITSTSMVISSPKNTLQWNLRLRRILATAKTSASSAAKIQNRAFIRGRQYFHRFIHRSTA